MSIQIVLFDIGGVFFEWKDKWLFRDVAKRFGLSEIHLAQECKKTLPFLRRGSISEKEMWQKVGRNIDSNKMSHANGSLIQDCFRERITVDSQVLDSHAVEKKRRANGNFIQHSCSHAICGGRTDKHESF